MIMGKFFLWGSLVDYFVQDCLILIFWCFNGWIDSSKHYCWVHKSVIFTSVVKQWFFTHSRRFLYSCQLPLCYGHVRIKGTIVILMSNVGRCSVRRNRSNFMLAALSEMIEGCYCRLFNISWQQRKTQLMWLELDRLHIYPLVPIADCENSRRENSRLWEQQIVNVTDCFLNNPNPRPSKQRNYTQKKWLNENQNN